MSFDRKVNEEIEKILEFEEIEISNSLNNPYYITDETYSKIRKNITKFISIFTKKDNYYIKNNEYGMDVGYNISRYAVLYNSLLPNSKITSYYAKKIKVLDVHNFLTDGILPQFQKSFENGQLDFHYYTYITKNKTIVNQENYQKIFRNSLNLDFIVDEVFDFLSDDKIQYDKSVSLYNFSRPNILKIASYHFTPLAKKYKFEEDFYKYHSIKKIIEFCVKPEEFLLDLEEIKDSIEKFKRKKYNILDKIKKSFTGDGSIWKFICSSDTLYLEELQFIAGLNGISNSTIMTKQDICKELESIYLNKKNNVLESCENSDDIGGDEVRDISPEYFYSYKIGNLTYCADIRTAFKNIESGNFKNPYTNVALPADIIQEIKDIYSTLKEKKNTDEKTYSQVLADFTSDIPYLNSIELYKNAPLEKIQNFVDLINDNIGFSGEKPEFTGDLEDYKYRIINILLQDLDNTGYSVRAVYNQVFSDLVQADRE